VLGDTVTIAREKNKISVTSENAFSKRWVDVSLSPKKYWRIEFYI
jgi:hypothetical protein